MSLWDRIDEESKGPLEALWEALPGGLNGIPDIVARRRATFPISRSPRIPIPARAVSYPSGFIAPMRHRLQALA